MELIKIVNEVQGINKITYDIISKPLAIIEIKWLHWHSAVRMVYLLCNIIAIKYWQVN